MASKALAVGTILGLFLVGNMTGVFATFTRLVGYTNEYSFGYGYDSGYGTYGYGYGYGPTTLPPASTGGGGGGGSLSKDTCPAGDRSSSYYDGTCGIATGSTSQSDNKIPLDSITSDGTSFGSTASGTTNFHPPYIKNLCPYNDRKFDSINYFDINASYAQNEILILTRNCVVNGRSATKFEQTSHATRAEVAKIIIRSLGEPYDMTGSTTSFADVPLHDWKTGVIERAYQLGIATGQRIGSKRYFRPDADISRNEVIKMFMIGLGLSTSKTESLTTYVARAAELGIISRSIPSHVPFFTKGSEAITREELAQFTIRAFETQFNLATK